MKVSPFASALDVVSPSAASRPLEPLIVSGFGPPAEKVTAGATVQQRRPSTAEEWVASSSTEDAVSTALENRYAHTASVAVAVGYEVVTWSPEQPVRATTPTEHVSAALAVDPVITGLAARVGVTVEQVVASRPQPDAVVPGAAAGAVSPPIGAQHVWPGL